VRAPLFLPQWNAYTQRHQKPVDALRRNDEIKVPRRREHRIVGGEDGDDRLLAWAGVRARHEARYTEPATPQGLFEVPQAGAGEARRAIA